MTRCAGASARSGRSARSASENGRLTTASRVWPSSRRWSAAARAAARSSIETTGYPGSAGPPWMITGSRRRTTASMIGMPVGHREDHERVDRGVEHERRVALAAARRDEMQRHPGAREPAQELDRRRVLEGVRERLAEHDARAPRSCRGAATARARPDRRSRARRPSRGSARATRPRASRGGCRRWTPSSSRRPAPPPRWPGSRATGQTTSLSTGRILRLSSSASRSASTAASIAASGSRP